VANTAHQRKVNQPGFDPYKPYAGQEFAPQWAVGAHADKVYLVSACSERMCNGKRAPLGSSAQQIGYKDCQQPLHDRLSAQPYGLTGSPSWKARQSRCACMSANP